MDNKTLIIAALCAMVSAPAVADLYGRQPEGWVWYDDRTKQQEPPAEEKKSAGTASTATGKSAKETLKALGEAMEEAEAQAVLNPTTDNVKAAIQMKKQVLALTQTYADRYEQIIWKNPDLDYTLERPMRADALFASSPLKQEMLTANLQEASKQNALVYVFRSDCPYCAKFAPVLKAFAEAHGFSILPVTLDGEGTSDFPYPKKDISMLRDRKMLPQVVPALYLVNPRKDVVEAVGFGLMNMVDLEKRVALAAGINLYEKASVTTNARINQGND